MTEGTVTLEVGPDLSGVEKALGYRGPHQRDHLRSVRFGKRMYLWEDPGTGVLRLVPDPVGQARWDRAQAAAARIWSPRG
jgi:hypothetical protein